MKPTKARKVPFAFIALPRTFWTWLAHLSGTEVTVYLAIAGETFAYNKFSARIPMSRLSEATGLHRSRISAAVKSLSDRQLLRITGARKTVTLYEVLTPPMMEFHVAKSGHESKFHVA